MGIMKIKLMNLTDMRKLYGKILEATNENKIQKHNTT